MNDHGESSTSGSSNIVSIISNSKNKAPEKKIKRKALTGLEKKAFCIKAQEHPNFTLETLAIEFGIKPNTVLPYLIVSQSSKLKVLIIN